MNLQNNHSSKFTYSCTIFYVIEADKPPQPNKRNGDSCDTPKEEEHKTPQPSTSDAEKANPPPPPSPAKPSKPSSPKEDNADEKATTHNGADHVHNNGCCGSGGPPRFPDKITPGTGTGNDIKNGVPEPSHNTDKPTTPEPSPPTPIPPTPEPDKKDPPPPSIETYVGPSLPLSKEDWNECKFAIS